MSIRTILVDDEPLATQGLQLRLQAFDDVEVVATAANGREAIRQIKTHKPDLVFLDIQMPGFDGFSVIQGLMDVEPPLFVFVTAYGEHALRAFDAQAVDYLMKPVDGTAEYGLSAGKAVSDWSTRTSPPSSIQFVCA